MIAVADTSPLNYLVQLSHAEVLPSLYGRVLVPGAVLRELQHPRAPEAVRSWAHSPPSWVDLVTPTGIDLRIPSDLGPGEREAIGLALEVKADILLMDERAGRVAAEAVELSSTGTLAMLLEASLRGRLDFAEALERLRQLNFRVEPRLATLMLERWRQSTKHT